MARTLYLALILSIVYFILTFSYYTDAFAIFNVIEYNLLLMLTLGLISLISSILGLKETWYESAMSYTLHEEIISKVKKELAILSLALTITSMILLTLILLAYFAK